MENTRIYRVIKDLPNARIGDLFSMKVDGIIFKEGQANVWYEIKYMDNFWDFFHVHNIQERKYSEDEMRRCWTNGNHFMADIIRNGLRGRLPDANGFDVFIKSLK